MNKKKLLSIIICVFIAVGMLGIVAVTGYKKFRSGSKHIATWVDDDTINSKIPQVKEICDKYGIKASFSCIANYLETNKWLSPTLEEYQKEGFDVLNHSYLHGKIWSMEDANYNLELCEEDIKKSISTMKDYGFDSDIFVLPYGPINDDIKRLVSKYFSAMLNINGGTNDLNNLDNYNINRVFIRPDTSGGMKVEQYYEMIDKAYENNEWIVFGTHSGIENQWNTELVEKVISYAIEKGFTFKTLSQVVNENSKAGRE